MALDKDFKVKNGLTVTDSISAGGCVRADKLIAGYCTNTAAGSFASVLGGTNNTASGARSGIGGGSFNTASGAYSSIVGGKNNRATTYGAAVLTGQGNRANGAYSMVGGGSSNTASGFYSSIGSGYFNTASGTYSSIGSGYCNCTSGTYSSIVGGKNNRAATYGAAVLTGYGNQANGADSMVGGGIENYANGGCSAIATGCQNRTCAIHAFVGGGEANCAAGNYSSVVAGATNNVTGSSSVILGGASNTLSHTCAFIAGTGVTSVSANMLHTNRLYANDLPTTNPGVTGVIWNDSNILTTGAGGTAVRTTGDQTIGGIKTFTSCTVLGSYSCVSPGSSGGVTIFTVAGAGNGNMKVRHIEGKCSNSSAYDHLYLNNYSNCNVYTGTGSTVIAGDLQVASGICHFGDTDTRLLYGTNTAELEAGGCGQICLTTTGTTINEGGLSTDFRVESNTVSHMLFVDGSADRVGIGTSAPESTLHVCGGNTKLESINGDSPSLMLGRADSGSCWQFNHAGTDLRIFNTDGVGSDVVIGANSGGSSTNNKLGVGKVPTVPLDVSGDANISGNVGIGTTSPSAKLEVYSNTSSTTAEARITNTGSGGYGGQANLWLKSTATGNTLLAFGPSTSGDTAANATGGISYGASTATLNIKTNSSTRMTINSSGNVGIGTTSPSAKLEVNGHFAATTKSFIIDDPKKGGKLQYGVVESNEHGVYVRGTSDTTEITLPDEWEWLVDADSVTVQLTSVGKIQQLFVIEQNNKKITIGGLATGGRYNYNVYGTRKDVDPLELHIK